MGRGSRMERYVYLTTIDNPFNPHTQWRSWYAWDTQMGYDSTSLLGRVVNLSNSLSDADQDRVVEEAIDEIVFYNLSGKHKKFVVREKKSELQASSTSS